MYEQVMQKSEALMIMKFLENEKEVSKYLREDGTMDMVAVQGAVDEMNKKKLLKQHPYEISQRSNGKWKTCLPPDETHPNKREIKYNRKEDLEARLVEYYSQRSIVHTIKEVGEEWLNQKAEAPNFKRSSYDRYANSIKRIFDDLYLADMTKLTDVVVEDYLILRIQNLKLTRRAWNDIKIVVKGIFKYAKRHKYTGVDIIGVLEYIDADKCIFSPSSTKDDSEEVFKDDEISKITEYIDNRTQISLVDLGVKLLTVTNFRVGELAGLKYSEFDKKNKRIQINRTEQHSKNAEGHTEYYFSDDGFLKKDHNAEYFILTDHAIDIIEEIHNRHPEDDFLFCFNGQYIRGQAFSKRLAKICGILGLPVRYGHKMRKTYATRLINTHPDPMLVCKQMRHNDITTTFKNYYFDNTSAEEKALDIQQRMGKY